MLCFSMTISCCSVLTEVGDIEADNRTYSGCAKVSRNGNCDIWHMPHTPLHTPTLSYTPPLSSDLTKLSVEVDDYWDSWTDPGWKGMFARWHKSINKKHQLHQVLGPDWSCDKFAIIGNSQNKIFASQSLFRMSCLSWTLCVTRLMGIDAKTCY